MDGITEGRRSRKPKRIVICLDGTWNKVKEPDQVTNVVKFAQAVMPTDEFGVAQLTYYNSGVGTGGPIDRFMGGVFGLGIRSNVHRAYSFLVLNYEPCDEIYIVGFSRGAYTARALAAMISAVGVLKQHEFRRFQEAWNFYRIPRSEREQVREEIRTSVGKARTKTNAQEAVDTIDRNHDEWFYKASVKAVGVWDTVGSYGIPSGLVFSGLGANFAAKTLGFHDRQLGKRIEHAFHAVGLDEARGPFKPTFWTGSPADDARCEQAWFPGVHADVGGGYPRTGLSDLALVWMMDRLRLSGRGLAFDRDFVRSIVAPCPACELHQSDRWFYRLFRHSRRQMFEHRPKICTPNKEPEYVINERLHWSVLERWSAKSLYGGAPWKPTSLQAIQRSGGLECKPVTEIGEFEWEILSQPRDSAGEPCWLHDGCWSNELPKELRAPGRVVANAPNPA